MVRPSALNIAKRCTLSPALGEQYGHLSSEAERGSAVDKLVCDWLRTDRGPMPADPDAAACCKWLAEHLGGWVISVQEEVVVRDPESGAILTRGTPDIVAFKEDVIWVIDLKKREQYWAGLLTDIDEDLQTHAYALGAWEGAQMARRYQKTFLLFGDGEVSTATSKLFDFGQWPETYDVIRDIQLAPTRATTGDHCLRCYSRRHCPAWLMPAYQGPSALEPFTKPQGLTVDNVAIALDTVQAMKAAVEMAEAALKEYAKKAGGIVVGDRRWAVVKMPGRRQVDTAALERDGLTEKYSKQGAPFEQFRWLRATPR